MPLSRYFPEEEMRKQITPSLLFTDDFSLERHGTKQAHEFNKIVSEHSEGGSTIHPETDKITEWLILFADQVLVNSALDHLVHNMYKIMIKAEIYREKTSTKRFL